MPDVPLACRCGTVRGTLRGVTPATSNHLVCMCADCQTYAHVLERADDVLDAAGGTDIVQVAPASYVIDQGLDQVRSLRLGPKGAIRFHTDCCHTPIGNTASASIPFVGVPTAFVDTSDGRAVNDHLGPPRDWIWARDARATPVAAAHKKLPPLVLLRAMKLLLMHRLRGRHRPFALYDAATGDPISPPRLLSLEERRAATPTRAS